MSTSSTLHSATSEDLVAYLEQGDAKKAYPLWNQYTIDPLEHPFLLNIFLSQSREKGRKDFIANGSGGVYFYDCRMKIAHEMMSQGFILHPFDETRDKQHKESHEIELLCREPLYAGMGNIHPTPFDEGNNRIKCLEYYLKQSTIKQPLTQQMFGTIAYVEPEEFTLMLVKEGLFDQAIKEEFPKDTIFDAKRADLFFATPNKIARSSIIERALDLGVITFDDMRQHHFTLFEVADTGKKPTLTLKMLEDGFRLPKVNDHCLDGGLEQSFYVWGEEQMKAWMEYDAFSMLLPIQFTPIIRKGDTARPSFIIPTLEEFVLNPQHAFLYLGFWRDGQLVRKSTHSSFEPEEKERIKLIFNQAKAQKLHQDINDNLAYSCKTTSPKKM